MKHLILTLALLTTLTSCCYRMPTEDDYCTVPRTNNPDLTREKSGGANAMMPNVNY